MGRMPEGCSPGLLGLGVMRESVWELRREDQELRSWRRSPHEYGSPTETASPEFLTLTLVNTQPLAPVSGSDSFYSKKFKAAFQLHKV